MMGWGDHGMGLTGWLMMGLGLLLFWGAVAAVLVAVVRGLWSEPRRDMPADPLRLLNERFARGELDEQTYLRRRDVLTSTPTIARARTR